MAAIRLTQFQGIIPATSKHLLPDTAAQRAANCRLSSGDIEPLNDGELAFTTAVTGTIQSIFRISETAGETWLAWASAVDCVQGPIVGLGRYYYTGDGVPKATTRALAITGGGDAYPTQFRALGLPRPLTAPTVTPSATGVGSTVSRYYCYTFYDDWDQETPPSPLTSLITGKVDDTWAVTGMDATPPNSAGISAITYVGNTVTLTSADNHFNRAGEKITVAGVTTVTNVNGTWTLTAVNTTTKTMTFVVDTAPTGTYNNATDTADTWTRVEPFGTCTKRLYRTSGTTSQFQLVAEDISATTYDDTLTDANILGDELISADWDMPPVDLAGLRVHPSGALVGYSGNELCFSEPYQPHAWPTAYRLRANYNIVGVGVFGSSVGVATEGVPYLALGSEPGQMVMDKATDAGLPCLSARGVVSTLTGVVYPSASGLVQVDDSGARIITPALYNYQQWEALNPSLMFGTHNNGTLYYAATPSNENTRILLFGQLHTTCTVQPTALYADQQNGLLYYVVGSTIYAFDRPTKQYMSTDWYSKEFLLPEPRTMTAAKIIFDTQLSTEQLAALQDLYDATVTANQALAAAGNLGGELNADALNVYGLNDSALAPLPELSNTAAEVSFSLYVDGELKYSTIVSGTRPFRLPSDYRGTRFSVRVNSRCIVRAVELADNPTELKRA